MSTKELVPDVVAVKRKPEISINGPTSQERLGNETKTKESTSNEQKREELGNNIENASTEGPNEKKYILPEKSIASPILSQDERAFITIPSPTDDPIEETEDRSPDFHVIANLKSFKNIAETMRNLEKDLGMDTLEPKDPNRLKFFADGKGSSHITNERNSREGSPISSDFTGSPRKVISGIKSPDKITDLKRSETSGKDLKRTESSGAKKHWTKLSHVFRSLTLFKSLEVKNIGNASQLFPEINNFNLRKWKDNLVKTDKYDFAKETLDELRTTQLLCTCAAIGSVAHLRIIREIITKDPKKFLYATDDPSHLLNKANISGQNMMYIAAKNGNLSIIDFLHQKMANPMIGSIIDKEKNIRELPLEAAIKWNHVRIVEYLIENHDYEADFLIHCKKMSASKETRNLIDKHMVRRSLKRTFTIFGCFRK